MDSNSKLRIVFLCSGGGGNLRFLHEAIVRGWIENITIAAVLTDRKCPANAFAQAVDLPTTVVDFDGEKQAKLKKILKQFKADMIITTVHRILRPSVVDQYRDRLINLHYSLLPAFSGSIGVRPVQDAIDYGARFTGVTVHYVDESVDGGKPIIQAAVPLISSERNFSELMNIVFRCGCIALMEAIRAITGTRTTSPSSEHLIFGRSCIFSPGTTLPTNLTDDFWGLIAKETDGDIT